jgi:predicted RNA-binding protein YlqC (UPF0109 family)
VEEGRADEAGVREVLEYIVRGLVGDPEAVRITEVEEEGVVRFRLSVAPEDLGKVIGRGGRTARAIREVVRAAGVRSGVRTRVEIVG